MIKGYNQFIKESNSVGYIKFVCEKYDIENWTINPDGTVDVDGDVYLGDKDFNELPIKFGKVTGDFTCSENKLTSLLGSPNKVGGDFGCGNNILTTLEGGPKEVGGYFNCSFNLLTSLKGAPDKVPGFSCWNNRLINFKYLPLASDYDLSYNPFYEFLRYFNDYNDKKNLGLYLRLFEDIVQYPYLDDLEFEELAKTLKVQLPEDWRDSVKSYKMLSKF